MNIKLLCKHIAMQSLRILILCLAVGLGLSARAFSPNAFAPNSVLAEGKWVKVSVPEDGLYRISASTLRKLGFSHAALVEIRGYGGRRLTDELSESTYVDDLPLVQSVVEADGSIVFYGIGAHIVVSTNNINYRRANDFSDVGHYFVGMRSEGASAREIQTVEAPANESSGVTSYQAMVHYEKELVPVPGEAGPLLLGEDFRYTRSRKFTFETPDAVSGLNASLACSFVSNAGTNTRLRYSLDGKLLPTLSGDVLAPAPSSKYVHASENFSTRSFALPSASKFELTLSVEGASSIFEGWLNFLTLNYSRQLRVPASGALCFSTWGPAVRVEDAADAHIWDVTNPMNIFAIKGSEGKSPCFSAQGSGTRNYAVWRSNAKLAEPTVVGEISNQNLHSLNDIDLVIVAPRQYASSALRLADFHAKSTDSLSVVVVSPDEVYNEFSSGTTDVGAFRRFFKMLYDRGRRSGHPLRYAVLMARTTQDNRRLSSAAVSYPTIPSWMPTGVSASLNDNVGFCTDDFTAFLEDNSGLAPRTDKLSIAIGRIPVTSVAEAESVVDKIIEYGTASKRSAWKHRFMFLADDDDNGIHLQQTEKLIDNICSVPKQQVLLRKVYMDAYELKGMAYPAARDAMFRYLDEGVAWWSFIGHASPTEWTGEHQLSYKDLNSMYLRHWPFIYAATCNFLRIDASAISGGELMFLERNGGAIGMISAVRPVYISDNGNLSAAMGRALVARDEKGMILTPGEVYRKAKNDVRDSRGEPVPDENRLRYTFIGDPALRMSTPSNIVVVDSIDGHPVKDLPSLAALGRARIAGHIVDGLGAPLKDFTGTVHLEIYDAEHTVTTKGNGENGSIENFEDYGERVFSGSAPVVKGRFSLSVAMPAEIAQNYRPATMSLYATTQNGSHEAVGLCRDFYVYGFDETAPVDTVSPVIESMVLNHSDFKSGDVVNTSPMLIAELRDDVGINLSNSGVGHQISAMLDGRQSIIGMSNYFTPAADGSPSGTLNYPMGELLPGNHSLKLRVFDTSGNSAESTVDFYVQEGLAPRIYDIYSDANPASTVANFYLEHNQPDAMATVTVTVYNLLGAPIWSKTQTGRSEMFKTLPVTWNLTDASGRRVKRGIYLYSATISTDGVSHSTASRRIAVTAK